MLGLIFWLVLLSIGLEVWWFCVVLLVMHGEEEGLDVGKKQKSSCGGPSRPRFMHVQRVHRNCI